MDELTVWAAGFFDGEGNIIIARSRSTHTGNIIHQVRAQIAQSKEEPLKVLRSRWGGSIHLYYTKDHKPMWQWALNGKMAISFLLEILPHLRIKNLQAEFAVQFPVTSGKKFTLEPWIIDKRQSLRESIMALNGRGRIVNAGT